MRHLRRPPRQNTLQRIAALRRVIELLTPGEMPKLEIRRRMKISESGCRKYINALMAGAIIILARREPTKFGDLGQPVYKLTASPEQIEQFLGGEAKVVQKQTRRRTITAPGRYIHVLADDAPIFVNRCCEPVKRDPLALPVEFFRSAEVRA